MTGADDALRYTSTIAMFLERSVPQGYTLSAPVIYRPTRPHARKSVHFVESINCLLCDHVPRATNHHLERMSQLSTHAGPHYLLRTSE
ncbi:hypothetical protein EVAR_90097_1 [Eumeta japonica]|uniref:Uncharacterized protein n=1 Tax=Eumeta variegata TaxID=151549 RepID=A0A4C1WXZ1_EUMVA|nr:hypothetical protein EVAR_90097_1 [Eumeta japonica]